MNIADWLRGLSLERYEQIFRDNAIELDVLPELSEADLEKLGILLGHRKIMLKAIAALRVPAPPPLAKATRPRGDTAYDCGEGHRKARSFKETV